MKPLKLKRAWIVTWVGSNTHEEPPVAILDYRKSAKTVRQFVEQLFMTLRYTPEEQLRYTKSPKDNPYPAEIHRFERITCGHNPLLNVRLVSDLHMVGDELKWTEPPSDTERMQKLRDAGVVP